MSQGITHAERRVDAATAPADVVTGTASAVYAGTLGHRRRAVTERSFRHPVHFAYLDLDELDTVANGRLVRRTPGAWRFRRRDYLAPHDVTLAEAVRDRIDAELGIRPSGAVRMLTQLRCFGMAFNPITLYYCFEAASDGERLLAVLAEVTNTPWRERHAYALGPFGTERMGRAQTPKLMHVSPFMGMAQRYEIALSSPGRTLSVHIDCVESDTGASEFDATLSLRRAGPLTERTLDQLIRRDPVAPLRTLTRIYAQGLALHRAKVPVHPHPTRGQT